MEKEEKNECLSCNAACCKSVAIPWREPQDDEDWSHLKWLVSHKHVHVYKDHEDDWLVEFLSDCEHLTDNNMCGIYDKRMVICKDHSSDDCEKTDAEEYHQIIFRCLKDVEDYLSNN